VGNDQQQFDDSGVSDSGDSPCIGGMIIRSNLGYHMFKQTHDTHTHIFNPDFKPINHVFAFPSRLSTTSGEVV